MKFTPPRARDHECVVADLRRKYLHVSDGGVVTVPKLHEWLGIAIEQIEFLLSVQAQRAERYAEKLAESQRKVDDAERIAATLWSMETDKEWAANEGTLSPDDIEKLEALQPKYKF